MSYIQIEIGGKLRGLKFNQGAIMWMQEKINPESYSGTTGYAMVWGGLKACCHVKGEELTKTVDGKEVAATFEDVCDWMDELTNEQNKSINECFEQSQAFKRRVAEQEDAKKKLQEQSIEPNVIELPAES